MDDAVDVRNSREVFSGLNMIDLTNVKEKIKRNLISNGYLPDEADSAVDGAWWIVEAVVKEFFAEAEHKESCRSFNPVRHEECDCKE